MKKVLFRGLIRKYGEKVKLDNTPLESLWVYGGILQGDDHSIIYAVDDNDMFQKKYSVYTETIGQYIGKEDKTGRKIFEGDIIALRDIPANLEDNGLGVVEYDEEDAKFIIRSKLYSVTFDCLNTNKNCEIMGNIYDNPELMEE